MPGHLEFLLEERSMEAFLRAWLPHFLEGTETSFETYRFQGKLDLLRKLENRLQGHANWLPENYRIVIVVDHDNEDCASLKVHLEEACTAVGLRSRRQARQAGCGIWQAVTRIVIEKLGAWYFGEWEAVRQAYPDAPEHVTKRAAFREPDAITRTWDRFEKLLREHGYFEGGLRKVDAARAIGAYMDVERSRSHSFKCFAAAIREAAT